MAGVYSTQIMAAGYDGETTTFTAPAGGVVVVRDIVISTGSGSGSAAIVAPTTITNNFTLLGSETVDADGLAHWTGRLVLNPGDQLLFYDADGLSGCVISGYVLTA